jgi:hypothetical protein
VLGCQTGTQINTIPVAKFVNTGNEFSKVVIGSDNTNYDGVISMDNNATLANTKLRVYIGNGTGSTAGHSNDQIVLQGNGNVGIGTTLPNEKLTVWTSSTTGLQTALRLNNPFGFANVNTGAQIVFSQDRSTAEDFKQGIIAVGQELPGTSTVSYMSFYTNSTGLGERVRISSNGITCFSNTVCAPCFATISDYRMKSNIRPIEGLSIIMNTKPYKFEYNYDCSTSFGMIAHELQDTLPEAVFGYKDGEIMQGVDYMKLLPITIKAIQEQQCTICTQASRITLLESCLGIA